MFRRILLLLSLVVLFVAPRQSLAQRIGDKSHLTPSLIADTTTITPGKPFKAGMLLTMDPGWHTYWRFGGDAGGAPRIEWQLPEGFTVSEIQWPTPHARFDDGDLLTYIFEDELLLTVEITPPANLSGSQVDLAAKVNWLVCEKTCIPGDGEVKLTLKVGPTAEPANAEVFTKWQSRVPSTNAPPFKVTWDTSRANAISLRLADLPAGSKPEFFPLPPEGATVEHPTVSEPAADGSRTITLPYSAEKPPSAAWTGVIALEMADGSRRSWMVTGPPFTGVAAPVSTREADAAPSQAAPITAPAGGKSAGLLEVLGIAFLGGLILNVMPCVLPVIALKIFGFVKQAGESRDRVFKLGLAFVAGVFVFFMGMATIAAILGRSFNWGYQFQNPFLLTGLVALVFVFALNMLGVFEITLGSDTASKLSELSGKEGYSGAFMHGLFTTLLGTSCTAPFLGQSLGYATTQSVPIIYLLFIAIAAGMSLPYLLLTANPAWLKYVPKPGMWMERVKQGLGFVVLAVSIWLLGVLAKNHGVGSGIAVSWYLFALGIGCWIAGLIAHRRGALPALLTIAVLGWFGIVQKPLTKSRETPVESPIAVNEAGGIQWTPWSEEAVTAAFSAGQPVFVDFTADWCFNCKYFERTALETEPVRAAVREKQIAMLRADWTKGAPAITKALRGFDRVGVPLYVLYVPGQKEPVVMDGLTQGGLLELLGKLPKGTATSVAARQP